MFNLYKIYFNALNYKLNAMGRREQNIGWTMPNSEPILFFADP
jgi:hypothetical protein